MSKKDDTFKVEMITECNVFDGEDLVFSSKTETSPDDIKAMSDAGMSADQITEILKPTTNNIPSIQADKPASKDSISLSALSERYNQSRVADRGGKWKIPSGDITKLRRLVEILDDIPCDSVTREHARTVRLQISEMPISAKYKNIPVNQVLSIVKKDDARMSIPNVGHYMTFYTSLFRWAKRESYYTPENPFEGLVPIDNTPKNEKRLSFKKSDLEIIFKGEMFTNHDLKKHRAHHYWAPLIALFTGARPAEIGALEVDDIYKVTDEDYDENIYALDINTHAGETSIKTINGIRRVPVHPKLIELGLIEYCEKQRDLGNVRLFDYLNGKKEVVTVAI